MANKKRLSRELANLGTCIMYRDYLTTIAQNSIKLTGLPEYIDIDMVNLWLVMRGAVVFFYDELADAFALLPFNITGKVDMYNNPTEVEAFAPNGYHKRLMYGEFVIIYDNTYRKSLYPTILQFAERMALNRRVEDINIFNQKTPKIYQCTTEQELTLKQMLESLDTFNTTVLTSDNLDFDKIQTDFNPVPFVADKISENAAHIFGEFLQLIGITSVSLEKKERLITSEITFSQGGALVSRMSRMNSRQNAVDKINRIFGTSFGVEFYDEDPMIKEVLDNGDEGNNTGNNTETNGNVDDNGEE